MNPDVEYMISKGWLPAAVGKALRYFKPQIEEVRLRGDGAASVTADSRNIRLGVSCTAAELENTLAALCSGSLHSYGDSLRSGYIDLGNGWRAGVCGQAITENGTVKSIRNVSSVSIRVPHYIENVSAQLYDKITAQPQIRSVLVYSPPGEGKTTLLRDLAVRLSCGTSPLRTALIDTRGELYDPYHMSGGLLDVYTGYPKAEAIELATRTMNPQYLICDELGTSTETDALLNVQNTGVPLAATAHAAEVSELLKRPNIRRLHDAGIFALYAGIKRRGNSYVFTFTERENADD